MVFACCPNAGGGRLPEQARGCSFEHSPVPFCCDHFCSLWFFVCIACSGWFLGIAGERLWLPLVSEFPNSCAGQADALRR